MSSLSERKAKGAEGSVSARASGMPSKAIGPAWAYFQKGKRGREAGVVCVVCGGEGGSYEYNSGNGNEQNNI
jgi:hypothetical protein